MNSADQRVWDLLQTIDLENLDIATFQGVAAPIFAQKENKEALEALALIAFARMARQGEFNGWLNAGGGGGGSGGAPLTQLYPGAISSTKDINYASTYWLADAYVTASNWCTSNTGGRVSLWPFTGGPGGDPDAILLNCGVAGTGDVKVAIYNAGTNNEPTSILAQANLGAFSTTGVKSWSPAITLEKDKLYYFAIMSLDSSVRPSLSLATDASTYAGWGAISSAGASPLNNQSSYEYATTVSGTFDDPAPEPYNAPFYDGTILMSLKYAGTA